MTAGLDEHVSATEAGALARRLFALGEGMKWGAQWYESDVRALAGELGWTWLDTAEGPRALTGLRAGDARAVPADREPDEGRGQEYAELAVPVVRAAPDALAQATAFRRVADAVTEVLGAAAVAGSYGGLRPFTDVVEQSWGTPYLRWQSGPAALELRAGAAGPELVLGRISLVTSWFAWLTHRDRGFPGFFGVRGRLADVDQEDLPEAWVVWSWEALSGALAGFLGTLAAESTALGLRFSMPLYGPVKGTTGHPMLFDVECDGRLYIGCYAPDSTDPAALGWQPAAALPHTHGFLPDDDAPRWRIDAGGPGEADASAVAELLVRTARAAGLGDPLSLVLGGEGEWTDPYEVKFYGLGLRTG